MKELPDFETLLVELTSTGRDAEERRELIKWIVMYFGDYDAHTILALIAYFKKPSRYRWLREKLIDRMVPY